MVASSERAGRDLPIPTTAGSGAPRRHVRRTALRTARCSAGGPRGRGTLRSAAKEQIPPSPPVQSRNPVSLRQRVSGSPSPSRLEAQSSTLGGEVHQERGGPVSIFFKHMSEALPGGGCSGLISRAGPDSRQDRRPQADTRGHPFRTELRPDAGRGDTSPPDELQSSRCTSMGKGDCGTRTRGGSKRPQTPETGAQRGSLIEGPDCGLLGPASLHQGASNKKLDLCIGLSCIDCAEDTRQEGSS